MSKPCEILQILQTLSEISGTNDKVQYLITNVSNHAFVDVCRLALDPLMNFGFKTIPNRLDNVGVIDDVETTVDKIRQLINTHYSNSTIDHLNSIIQCTDQDGYELIKRMITKDLRCGVQLALFNRAIISYNKMFNDDIEPIFSYPCMLTSAYSEKLINKLFANNPYLICQQKCDGMRFNAVVDNNCNVTFYGRSGKQIHINDDRFYKLFEQFGPSVVVDGELLIDGKQDGSAADRKIGNGILNKAVRATITEAESKHITAVLWDIIPLENFRKLVDNSRYEDRYNRLSGMINRVETDDRIFLVETIKVANVDQVMEMFNRMIEQNKEGVIVKSPNAVWKDVRSTEMCKVKAELTCELRVNSITAGTGRFEGMVGALNCSTDDRTVQVAVGTGFTELQRQQLFNDEIIGKVISVVYNARIHDKNRPDVDSLFLPRFIEIREDKDTTDRGEDIK